jgi:hypothetical protein
VDVVVACGREFTPGTLARIRARVRSGGDDLTRAGLARDLCDWMDWRDPAGRVQEMSARVALLRLERGGHIELPSARNHVPRGAQCRRLPARTRPEAVHGPLEELGTIGILEVSAQRTPDLFRQWKELIEGYHYIGYVRAAGRQKRYLIVSEAHGVVAAAAFSAAAWRCAARDQWIGWSEAQRREHLQKVVSNSRFLIAPWVEVKNLASHLLARLSARVLADWRSTYGYEPLLLETFVDPERFAGTCYRGAGWLHVGETAGFSRGGHEAVAVKHVYVSPLHVDCRRQLCGGQLPAPPADWAEGEFGGAELGDARLVRRLVEVGRNFFARPQANIPEASQGRSRTKAAYRLLDQRGVGMKEFLSAHVRATIDRAREESVVLAVQDTTSLNYTGLKEVCGGLGRIGTDESGAVGLIVHDTVVFTPAGLALGVLDAQVWARDTKEKSAKRTREKESRKWLVSYERSCALQTECGKRTTVLSVGDREADFYELFCAVRDRKGGAQVLVRACQNRSVREECGYLFDHMHGLEAGGEYELTVEARHNRKARQATLSVRLAKVILEPPKDKKHLGPVEIYAVLAREETAPGGEPPLEWLLLTTVAVGDFEQAQKILSWYTVRWAIEVFHRTLKSGCRIEDRQLENAHRLENCLAIDMVVAWRILHLRHLSRVDPDAPCTVYFTQDEYEALYAVTHADKPLPTHPIAIREATRLVAMLGGFLARKSDGEPGAETLWRGLQRLDAICIGWRAARRIHQGGP